MTAPHPGPSAPVPVPALDRALLADAAEALAALKADGIGTADVLVLDDDSGALTHWALTHTAPAGTRVFVRCRSFAHATARAAEIPTTDRARVLIAGLDTPELDPEEFLAAHNFEGSLALGRLPKSLHAIDDLARATARHAARTDRPFTLLLGGNTKHMTRSMNNALEAAFAEVTALRGRGKFRSLRASHPKDAVGPHEGDTRAGITGLGGVFSGGRADRGGGALAAAAADWLSTRAADGARILDLGCGNGSVLRALASDPRIEARVVALTATDVDADAVRSARVTLAPWAEKVAVTWDDAGVALPDRACDLVLLNPPFHEGTRVDATLVGPLLDAAHRLLSPGGTLFFVHNSHLRYRPELEKRFTRVEQVSRDRTFTVLRASGVTVLEATLE